MTLLSITTRMSVSAVGLNADKAPYSNFGSTVDVVAPGGDISVDLNGDGYADGVLSTHADDSVSPLDQIYSFSVGTSMAAPHMAGVAALMLSVNPTLTPDDVNMLLAGTHPDPKANPITQDLGDPGRDDIFGHGLIDAFQAVNVAQDITGGGDGTPPPVDMPALAVSPESLNFGATATTLQLIVSNAGTGQLDITSITDDAPWMTVDDISLPTVTVRGDRTGLAVGTFVGSILITSNGGNRAVPVTMQVQSNVSGGDVGTVFVVVLDPDTRETIDVVMTTAGQGYVYQTSVVPEGAYLVVAGTDRDNDGLACDRGEACGIFPLLDSPTTIDVNGDQAGIDFSVSLNLLATTIPQGVGSDLPTLEGFRRLEADGFRR
jgi:serine protease